MYEPNQIKHIDAMTELQLDKSRDSEGWKSDSKVQRMVRAAEKEAQEQE